VPKNQDFSKGEIHVLFGEI